jgi:hypothetical protein
MSRSIIKKLQHGEEITVSDFILSCSDDFLNQHYNAKSTPKEIDMLLKYCSDRISDLTLELEELEKMSDKQINSIIDTEHNLKVSMHKKRYKELSLIHNRYTNMISQVEEWAPSLSHHIKLKEYCLKLLDDAIHTDCSNMDLFANADSLKKDSPEDWTFKRKLDILKDLSFYTELRDSKAMEEAMANDWKNELMKSLL